MILKMGTVKFHPQGNWKPLGSPLTFALHICFILKGIERNIDLKSPADDRLSISFILKGIERIISIRATMKIPGKSFILKGIES